MLRLALALALIAAPAHADPVSLSLIAMAASAAVSVAGLTGITLALAQLAVGIGFTLLSAQIQKNKASGQADLKRELARPSSLPPYRFVYGRTRTYGSPWPWYVKDKILYGVILFNSRPSRGNFRVFFDKREMTISGDPYNLAGPGAVGVEDEFDDGIVKMWIGRGDQTSPPSTFVSECPEKFKSTDRWQNLTVGFFRLDCGSNEDRAERWPSTPPGIEFEGDWSLLWDPRDSAQSASDASTWKYSANRTLCVLDALMRNPIRPFRTRSLMIDTFRVSADIDDERVPLKAGGTEPRYACNGLLTWDDAEIEDQVAPLILAGAGGTTRVGGRLGMIPGAWQAPDITITDILEDDGLTYEVLKPGADLATEVRATYIAPDREWEQSDAGVYVVPGAAAIDGGESTIMTIELPFVTSPTQGQRRAKFEAMRQRAQRRITSTLPPDAFDAVGGSNLRLSLPSPYGPMNGNYQVQTIQPAMDITGESGVAMRCPTEMLEIAESDYAWTPATDEQDVEKAVAIVATRREIPAPAAITAVTGSAAAAKSGADRARIKIYWAPVNSGRVTRYQWEFRESGASWQSGGYVDDEIRDSSSNVFAFLRPVEQGQAYDIRVRSMDGKTSASVWTYVRGVVALGPDISLSAPTPVSTTGAVGRITVAFLTPSSDDVIGLEIWARQLGSSDETMIARLGGAASSTIVFTHTGIGGTWTYRGKTRGPYGSTSAFSAPISGSVNTSA